MATNNKNKVKFGLNNVHWAKILSIDEDGKPTYDQPVRLPGAVSLSVDASGENSNFYADNGVYYVISNNSGYDGSLEVALVPMDFSMNILGEKIDANGVLYEVNTAEASQFALMFEFDGDRRKIRHVIYCCTASRPATSSSTIEDKKEVKTQTLKITAAALKTGLIKAKSGEATTDAAYQNWYKAVYMPYFGGGNPKPTVGAGG